MFSTMGVWFKSHAAAILATVVVVSKAGLLGKAASTIVTTLAMALTGSIS